MVQSQAFRSDLNSKTVNTPWRSLSSLSSLAQIAIGSIISFRRAPIASATSHEAALVCHKLRNTIDISKAFASGDAVPLLK